MPKLGSQLEVSWNIIVGIVLSLSGGILLWQLPEAHLTRAFGDALLIAGLLTVCVDYFVKRDLAREAAQNIFHHILGFDQPPEIRDRLKAIVHETKIYRRNYRANIHISSHTEGVLISVKYSFDLVNPTNQTLPFTQKVSCERGERLQKCRLWMTSADKKYQVDCTVKVNEDDPDAMQASAEEVSIKPHKKEHTYTFGGEYSQIMPKDFFFVLYFGDPTIGVSLELTHTPDLRINATIPNLRNGDMFEYEGLFMPGDHLYVRWESVSSSVSQTSEQAL